MTTAVKPKKPATKSPPTTTTRTKKVTAVPSTVEATPENFFAEDISHELIARKAYEIWQATGCSHGYDREHWLRAEQELRLLAR